MSCLLVQPEHLEASLAGEKTETRRLWDSARLKPGNSYRLLRAGVDTLFTPRDEAPAYAVVDDVYTEPLGKLDKESAEAEGGYTVDEFKRVWRDLHGEWTPEREVYVVEYEAVEQDPRRN